jgi:pSer/pThr/pTyr-binding forkhead associated (FHA) protein
MIEVFLIHPTPEGSQEIPLEDGGQISLGRGSDADLRFDDDGMSRLNATIFREGENVWVLDENSTNGTFVNGREVSPSGTVLKNGDAVKIGHYTTIRIRIAEKQAFAPPSEINPTQTVAATAGGSSISPSHILPIAITAFAILIIGISAIFIGVKVLGNNQPEIVRSTPSDAEDFPEDYEDEDTKKSPTPKASAEKTPETSNTAQTSASPDSLPESNNKTVISSFSRKKYTEMSESEKDAYIKEKAEKVARIIGNQSSEPIPAEAVKTIRGNLQGYINRIRAGRVDNCTQGKFTSSDMTTVMQRASKNAPFIIRAFYGEGLDPQLGLYVAMIESEHCPCLQSPTKALGMFQFVRGTGREYNLSVKDDASPTNPDQRCEPEPSARAAAQYLKTLTGRFGTGPMSVMLAVASYNSGQGGLSKNLEAALRAASNQERSFWTLVANQVAFEGRIGEQFRKENVKYVPKFFAAAIIGENPQDFGIDMQPLSTYTK